MIAEVMGTVEKGALKLDDALPFPDRTRVKLTIEPITQNHALEAWNRLLRLMDEKPIVGLAGKFSREGLYERD